MNDDELIREIATKAFADALEARSQELAEDIARRMSAALQPPAAQRDRTTALRDGSLLIAGSRSQTETLETLLAASSAISAGCGLLILRGAQAGGWNCQGLTSLDLFKRAVLDCSHGVAAKVIASCRAAEVRASELDRIFAARIGLNGAAKVALIPVLLKGRVSALLLALAPEGDEAAALEVLVQVAQLVLDVQAYRKAPPPRPAAQEPNHAAAAEAPTHAVVHPAAVEVPQAVATYVAETPAAEHENVPVEAVPNPEPPAVEHQHEVENSVSEAEHVDEAPAAKHEQVPAEDVAVAEPPSVEHDQEAESTVPEAEHIAETPEAEHEPVTESGVPEHAQVEVAVTSWQAEAAKALESEREVVQEVSAVPAQPMPEPEHEPVETAAEAVQAPEAVAVQETSQPEPEAVYAAVAVTSVGEPEVHVPHLEADAPTRITYSAFHENSPASQVISQAPDESHQKARRFAKLLVEEIKLYNQSKVAEGRAHGDLYLRLREDIEKSRAAYHKRYGQSVRDVDYFSQEILRILADNNPSVMGAGFPS